MSDRVRILVCYKEGTKDILDVWFSAMQTHTERPLMITAIVVSDKAKEEAEDVLGLNAEIQFKDVEVVQVSPPVVPTVRIHGSMLDSYLANHNVKEEFVLTIDSDCFPIADGWLNGLLKMMDNGASLAGILHPWCPPAEDMDHKKIEWRIRSQHCWNTTHVACQMIRTSALKEWGNYTGGDDTGLLIPKEVKNRGLKIDGYKVSRCAIPQDGSDPEYNRFVCLVFGDKMYHHGGFTRIASNGEKPMMDEAYGWVKQRVLDVGGAEFLLDDAESYRFKFDREEEVAALKMNLLFGEKTMEKK